MPHKKRVISILKYLLPRESGHCVVVVGGEPRLFLSFLLRNICSIKLDENGPTNFPSHFFAFVSSLPFPFETRVLCFLDSLVNNILLIPFAESNLNAKVERPREAPPVGGIFFRLAKFALVLRAPPQFSSPLQKST